MARIRGAGLLVVCLSRLRQHSALLIRESGRLNFPHTFQVWGRHSWRYGANEGLCDNSTKFVRSQKPDNRWGGKGKPCRRPFPTPSNRVIQGETTALARGRVLQATGGYSMPRWAIYILPFYLYVLVINSILKAVETKLWEAYRSE